MTFPLGPYHPALPEPMSLRLTLRGETVTSVDSHTGYVRRGVESLATKRDLTGALALAERVCGTCGHSHRLAFCQALEALVNVTPPPRALYLRTAFAELERAQARLWLLALLARAMDHGTLHHAAIEAREVLFEGCLAATGARLFWGIPIPGGAASVEDPAALADALGRVTAHLAVIERQVGSDVFTRRWAKIGVTAVAAVENLRVTGLVARASGIEDDLRRDAPYAAYDEIADELIVPSEKLEGDVASRARVATLELGASLRAIQALLDDLPEGQERAAFPANLPEGETESAVEGPHGLVTVALRVGRGPLDTPGWLSRLTIKTPSAEAIGLVPIVLERAALADVPVILASLDLCVACVDL